MAIKRPTHLPYDQLYEALKPADKVLLICVSDDVKKGVAPTVRSGWAQDSLVALMYAGLIVARDSGQFGIVETKPPVRKVRVRHAVVHTITGRGVRFLKYLLTKTNIDELIAQLPRDVGDRLKAGRG